jgi:hypothetical protein
VATSYPGAAVDVPFAKRVRQSVSRSCSVARCTCRWRVRTSGTSVVRTPDIQLLHSWPSICSRTACYLKNTKLKWWVSITLYYVSLNPA